MRASGHRKIARQYLIDLQRWRSILASVGCSISMICSMVVVGSALIHYTQMGWEQSDYFRYFTTLSNLLAGIASGFILPFAVNGIRKKRFVYPGWLSIKAI